MRKSGIITVLMILCLSFDLYGQSIGVKLVGPGYKVQKDSVVIFDLNFYRAHREQDKKQGELINSLLSEREKTDMLLRLYSKENAELKDQNKALQDASLRKDQVIESINYQFNRVYEESKNPPKWFNTGGFKIAATVVAVVVAVKLTR